MESIIAGGEDAQIPELDVSVYQNQASFVVRREQTTTTCATPEIRPGAVRTAKLTVVDGNFLDLSTLHFSFLVRNNSTNQPLQPLSALPHGWWRRLIVKVNGATCEDTNFVSRVENQISQFVSTNKRRNWGDAGHGWATLTDLATDAVSKEIPFANAAGISGVQRVTWRPLSSGFLQQKRLRPMLGGASGGLSIELECADLVDACSTAAGKSQDWQLEKIQLHVDSVQLTSEMISNFADMLIRGESIYLPFTSNSCDVMYLNGGSEQVLSLAKQYSRLATVGVSLGVAAGNTIETSSMNNQYLAAASAETVESYIQVNNQRWPQFNIVGVKQHYHRLLQALGVWNSASHAVNISADGYGNGTDNSTQFIAMYDLESMPGSEASGCPVQGGGTVQLTLRNVGAPTRAYVTTHFDSVLEIKSQGAIVYS